MKDEIFRRLPVPHKVLKEVLELVDVVEEYAAHQSFLQRRRQVLKELALLEVIPCRVLNGLFDVLLALVDNVDGQVVRFDRSADFVQVFLHIINSLLDKFTDAIFFLVREYLMRDQGELNNANELQEE